MELGAAGLQEQPFRTKGRPLVFVGYTGQEAAFEYLERTYAHRLGLGLFQGPPLSGKSTLLRQFADLKSEDFSIAIVDGSDLDQSALLHDTLQQFGYDFESGSDNELLNMLKVFLQQQTASGQPPLLVVENVQNMLPGALKVLCELAELRVKQHFALHLVMSSDQPMSQIVDAPAMSGISKRVTQTFSMKPLRQDESRDYLYAKLRAGGCLDPESVLPFDVCLELHDSAGGWPGILDRLSILALAKADVCPIRPDQIERPVLPNFVEDDDTDQFLQFESEESGPPKLVVTLNGEVLRKMTMNRQRTLIGRSEHNDLCIDSTYVSRHHAMFVKFGPATLLMDLNSKNGTLVNSRRMSNQVMINNDIISIGHHRIKFIDPSATERSALEGDSFADTAIMKDLSDLRARIAKDSTMSLPAAPDSTGNRPKA